MIKNETKYFTVRQLQQASWFPYKNRTTILRYILSGKLKAQAYGSGTGKRYIIAAVDITRFLEKINK